MAHPMWRSISTIFSTDDVSSSVEVTRFSTPRTTPPPVATPIAVDPSLIASREYSTWKRRPSGEKVLEKGLEQATRKLVPGAGYVLDASICYSVSNSSKRSMGALNDLPYSDRAINILEKVKVEEGQIQGCESSQAGVIAETRVAVCSSMFTGEKKSRILLIMY